jgi:hypothetical protein
VTRSRNDWLVSGAHADLVRAQRAPVLLAIAALLKPLTIDLARTGIVVVDMQNDFCHPDSLLASSCALPLKTRPASDADLSGTIPHERGDRSAVQMFHQPRGSSDAAVRALNRRIAPADDRPYPTGK